MSLDPSAPAAIRRVTLLGSAINLGLTAVKLSVGLLVGSLALVADALHSLSDLASDVIVLIGVKFGSRPPDATHPFGHGKIETLATLVMGGLLVTGGVLIILKSGGRLSGASLLPPGWPVMVVALISIVSKEWIYRRTLRVSRRTNSAMLLANAWHHRSDALSSVVVLLGAGSLLLGWRYGDAAAGLVVGLMVVYAGGKIAANCVRELGEAGVDHGTQTHLAEIVKNQPGVAAWHRLRARRAGREILMDVHILVDPAISVTEGHQISKQVEAAIAAQMGSRVNVTVHIEPNLPEEQDGQD